MPKPITQEYLKTVLHYDPDTGVFVWKVAPKNHRYKIGSIAGRKFPSSARTDYIAINIDRQIYAAHRLAFLYMLGSIPTFIDHKDRNGFNNIWSNLRPATKQQNAANIEPRMDNKSGYKGVCYRTDPHRDKRWRASIFKDGKQTCIGTFWTPQEAAQAFDQVALVLFGEFAITNKSLGLIK